MNNTVFIATEYNRKLLADGKLAVTDAQSMPVKNRRRANNEAIIYYMRPYGVSILVLKKVM